MKKWHYPFLLLLIAGTVVILTKSRKDSTYHTDSGFVFGTTYTITYRYGEDIEDRIKSVMQDVDNALSMFNDSSTISRVNRNEPVCAADDSLFITVFRKAMEVSELTGGAFDITVAPAVNAWGFGFKDPEYITDHLIDSLKTITGYRKIHESDGHIIKQNQGMMLDCSAIAKGFGCDAVAGMLRGKGISDFMVEIGGEVVVSGLNPHGEKWNIGVANPVEDTAGGTGGLNTVLHLSGCAMATSGNYRNFYEKDGVKYAHTINPATCRPVSHSLLSATVIAGDCATADALATSFMVMGVDSAAAFVARNSGIQAYFIVSAPDGMEVVDLLDDSSRN